MEKVNDVEQYIGKSMYGFKYDSSLYNCETMDSFIDKKGLIVECDNEDFRVLFVINGKNYFRWYPIDVALNQFIKKKTFKLKKLHYDLHPDWEVGDEVVYETDVEAYVRTKKYHFVVPTSKIEGDPEHWEDITVSDFPLPSEQPLFSLEEIKKWFEPNLSRMANLRKLVEERSKL